MRPVTLLQPPRIVFGNGCAASCVELFAQRRIRKVLLVTSKSVIAQLGSLVEALKQAGCEVAQSPFVSPEPTRAQFDAILDEAKSANVEAVLGIGGGSALDVAKLIAALARSTQNIRGVFGINQLQNRELFLVCLPTTSGTGSEVSPNAILLDEEDALKKGVISPYLVPDAAYIDPLLTLSVPPAVTAYTGLDALTHCIEAYANKFAHPIVDNYALRGIELISANLLRAVRDGSDAEARADVALGSLYGGLCLGPVNTAAVHALAYPLGSEFRIAHGLSNSLLLPHVLRFNLPAASARYAQIARALGAQSDADDTKTATRGIDALAKLSTDCGVPQTLSELNVPKSALPRMAEAAMKVTRLLRNNVREVTTEDAQRTYEEAF